jgi:tetratricopeptide (TPR) repeat protein
VPVSPGDSLSHTRLLQEDLLARLEERLEATPDLVELQIERAHLLAELMRPKEAAQAYAAAIQMRRPNYSLTTRAYSILPFHGKTLPITVLLLVAPEWGNAPFRRYLDDQTFLTLQVITDFHDPALGLPPHHLVINAISDGDSCHASLDATSAILARTSAPCVNFPAYVLASTREGNARRLGTIAGVRTPKIGTYSREFFAAENVVAKLREQGFTFPLLVRAPGYHTGQHFFRVEFPHELSNAISRLPGDRVTVIEFLDARGTDGLIRKYRVLTIGGRLLPAHAAVAQDWKSHFFTSSGLDHPEHRREDQNFLENMECVLGPRVMEALREIQKALGLDYAGIDFSIGTNGEILLFEANATMNVPPPDSADLWAYRRAPTQRIADAIRALFFAKAFAGQDSRISPTQILREFTLERIQDNLARNPDRIDLKIERARLLIEMERFEEAKDIYLSILTTDPTQFVALNNLGILLRAMGYHQAALKVHREVAALIPKDIKARLNLANSLRECSELDEARANYEMALREAPDHAEAHQGLAYVLMYLREKEAAGEHWKKALANRPPTTPIFDGKEGAPRILIFSSPCGGNSPITRILDRRFFQTCHLVPDFHDPSAPLPPHDLVVNAVGDADQCGTSLAALAPLLAKTLRPVINRPERVQTTGRIDNARLLGKLEDVITPRTVSLSRDMLTGHEGLGHLEQQGFHFPLLLRSPGFHEGSHFLRVDRPEELAGTAAQLPGRNLIVIEHLDARDDDGKIRKFRAMMIDGRLYPLHKAISREWMIHYHSAEMAHSAEHRAEDAAYLDDMPAVLGPRAMRALERIRFTLALDYAGADFSLGRNGEVLLFEANATMSVPTPEPGEKWDFRRPAVEKIQAAVREMIRARASFGHSHPCQPSEIPCYFPPSS